VCLVARLEALNVVSIALCAYPKPIARSKSSCRIDFALEYRRHFALGWNLGEFQVGVVPLGQCLRGKGSEELRKRFGVLEPNLKVAGAGLDKSARLEAVCREPRKRDLAEIVERGETMRCRMTSVNKFDSGRVKAGLITALTRDNRLSKLAPCLQWEFGRAQYQIEKGDLLSERSYISNHCNGPTVRMPGAR
jgi:hypothetical protein